MVKSWSFPFKPAASSATLRASDVQQALALCEDGFFPVGANGLWHGGVHFGTACEAQLNLAEGVRCIADGEVVAYRLDARPLEQRLGDSGRIARYSSGFVLVRHKLELPPPPGTQQATPEPADTLTFFSVYMHLAGQDAYDADSGKATPTHWGGSRYSVGERARDTTPAGVTGLNARSATHQVIGIVPRGTRVELGEAHPTRRGYSRLASVSGEGFALPADGSPVYVYVAELDRQASADAQAIDRVYVLPTPRSVAAGALIGHLGEYQRYDDASPLPASTPPRPLTHIEVFAGDDLPAFIERCRARAVQFDARQRTLLHLQVGARLCQAVAADRTFPPGVQFVEQATSPKKGPWALATPMQPQVVARSALSGYQPGPPATYLLNGQRVRFTGRFFGATDTEVTNSEAESTARGYRRREVLVPSGEPVWIDRGLLSSAAGGPAWSTFPLRRGENLLPASSQPRVVPRRELDALPAAQQSGEADGTKWWQVRLGADGGTEVTGWVREAGHPATEWVTPWQWAAFEIVSETAAPQDMFMRDVGARGGATNPSESADIQQRAERVNSGPLFTTLFDLIDQENRDGRLSLVELRRALNTQWLADRLVRIIARYESEWGGPASKWDALDSSMLEAVDVWRSEKERIGRLRFWDDATGIAGFPGSPVVHHMHVVGLVANFQGGCQCAEDLTAAQLSAMAPNAPQARIEAYLPSLNDWFRRQNMTSCINRVHFLAQTIHESGEFQFTRELGTNLSYDPWRGRGLIQITFETNYAAYGQFAGVDVTSGDEARARMEQTPHSVGSAFWYWSVSRSLDAYGEADDFIWLTISVNGGLNGYDHRLRVANAGIRALGIQSCAVKNVDGVYRLEDSNAYSNRRGCFAWGLWNDPGSTKSGKTKIAAQALIGYRRYLELWEAAGRPNDGGNNRPWYGYSAVASHAQARVAALAGGG